MDERPNILLVTLDQWRADCLSAVGHPVLRTPALDALAQDGVLFRRHYAQASPCGPSRACLLTGTYLMNNRSVNNGTPLDARFTNVARELRRAGYLPALVGYTDTSADPRGLSIDDPALATYEGPMPGFELWLHEPGHPRRWLAWLRAKGYDVPASGWGVYEPDLAHPGVETYGRYYSPLRIAAEHSDTAFTTDAALDFIAQADRPWCLHLSYLRPHPPWIAPEPYNRLYAAEAIALPRRAPSKAAEAALHPYLGYVLDEMVERTADWPERDLRQLRACYWGLVAEADHHLGRLLDGLRATGAYDRTLVVVTSDHGEMLGDHHLVGKDAFFEEAYRVPLIVRAPGGAMDRARGRIVEAFTESVDVMPTLLELAGLLAPQQCNGASLVPWLRGEAPADWRREAHFEHDFRDLADGRAREALGLGPDECALAAIRGERWKYVHFAGLPPLLFDLLEDPGETTDLSGKPGRAATALAVAQRMLSWRLLAAERTLTGVNLNGAPREETRGRRPVLGA